jgi:hypothetical protein
MSQLVTEYEEFLQKMQHVPEFSYGRSMLRDDGSPNRFFLTYLFTDQASPQSGMAPYCSDVG